MSVQGYLNSVETQALRTSQAPFSGSRPKDERRGAVSFIYYPQPFGLQAEYNLGEGPAYERTLQSIRNTRLSGGYLQAMYRSVLNESEGSQIMPFVKFHTFDGGKKQEADDRLYRVRDWEFGAEWQAFHAFELTLDYTISHRITSDRTRPWNDQRGSLLRVQAQFNY
jgi:hypothetical protein